MCNVKGRNCQKRKRGENAFYSIETASLAKFSLFFSNTKPNTHIKY